MRHQTPRYAPATLRAPLRRNADLSDLRFRQLVPAADWDQLPRDVRIRFTKRLAGHQSAIYRGHVIETRFNLPGRILAQLLRVIGAPLPIDRYADDSAAIVTVTEDPCSNGQFWSRQYNRRTGFPQVIHSTKAFAGDTGLEEIVGAGIGMSLHLKVDGQHLTFVSHRYFLKLFGLRLKLPKLLEPGHLTVGHHDLGDGRFEFTLDLHHPLFGELVHQRAVFTDMT